MPARASIVLTDGTTPVTLTPSSGSPGLTEYRGTALSPAAVNPTMSFSYRTTPAGVNRQTVVYKQPMPVTDANTSITSSSGNMVVEINLVVPGNATLAQRAQAVKRGFDALTALQTELTTGEGQW